MTAALGVLFIAVGAVLTFAVDASVPGIDLVLAGALLMLVGATGVAMSMMRWTPRRRAAGVAPRRSSAVRRTVRL